MEILKKGMHIKKKKLDIYTLKCHFCNALLEFDHTECKSLTSQNTFVSDDTVQHVYSAENKVGTVICPVCGGELDVEQSDYVGSVYVKI